MTVATLTWSFDCWITCFMLKVLPHWFLISWILCFYKPYFHLSRFEAGSSFEVEKSIEGNAGSIISYCGCLHFFCWWPMFPCWCKNLVLICNLLKCECMVDVVGYHDNVSTKKGWLGNRSQSLDAVVITIVTLLWPVCQTTILNLSDIYSMKTLNLGHHIHSYPWAHFCVNSSSWLRAYA